VYILHVCLLRAIIIANTKDCQLGFFNALIYFSKADQGKKKARTNGTNESSSVGLSQFWNKSRQWMSTRKGSDITTDLGDTTTNDNGADDFVSESVKVEEQKLEEGDNAEEEE